MDVCLHIHALCVFACDTCDVCACIHVCVGIYTYNTHLAVIYIHVCIVYTYIYIYVLYIVYVCAIRVYIIYLHTYIYIHTSEFRSLDGMSFPVLKFRKAVDIVGLRRRVKGEANKKKK